jgi:cobalt-zinc-cadmium efflux system membrane fusion protein
MICRRALFVFSITVACCNRQEESNSVGGHRPPLEQAAAGESGELRFPSDSPQLKRLRVEEVRAEPVSLEQVVVPGKIEADPARISRVALPAAGRVKRVMVTIGDAVTGGQPVLAVDSPDAGAAVSVYHQAQARLNQAKAAQVKAEADLSRIQDLFENKAVAQKDVVAAETTLAQARADVTQADAALEESRKKLQIFGLQPDQFAQDILVQAPVSGKVLEVNIAAGEYRNDTSAPVMTIADLSVVFMTADVPENQIRLIRIGEPVEIALNAYPGEMFKGHVTRIADTLDPQTRTVKVRAELQNPAGRLRPEMFGEIRHSRGLREMPVVPAGAIIQGDQRNIVYREKAPGVFEVVEVTFGKRGDDRVPILSGIQTGDRIVTDGAMLLRNY